MNPATDPPLNQKPACQATQQPIPTLHVLIGMATAEIVGLEQASRQVPPSMTTLFDVCNLPAEQVKEVLLYTCASLSE